MIKHGFVNLFYFRPGMSEELGFENIDRLPRH